MNASTAIGLIENAALLLALAVIYDWLAVPKADPKHPRLQQVIGGALAGAVGVIIMTNPVPFGPGIQFDTRSVLLSVTALFFGPIAAAVATALTLAFRVHLGGAGVVMGVAVILTSSVVGLAWRSLRRPVASLPTTGELLALGAVVHLAMLVWMAALPGAAAASAWRSIALPVMLIYPLTTAVLGRVLVGRGERHQATDALRQSEEKFRRLFQDHAAVKLLIDPATGRVADANEAAARFYGWSVDELRSMHMQDINALPADRVAEEMERARHQKRIHFEFRHRRADGSLRDVEVLSSSVDIGGRPYLHSIVHDITGKRVAEEERQQLAAQLVQAKKMEAVGRLAGGVAHDYNNMLGVILGYADLGLGALEPAHPVHPFLEEIRSAARRSAALTQQLLAFSRQQAIAPQLVDLNEAVEGMLKMLRRLIGEDVHIAWHPGSGVWPVMMDLTQLDQILVNLCVNARDAIADVGTITIETRNATLDDPSCAAHPDARPGAFTVLSVSDNGVGMDADTREHLFEPFFTTKDIGKGTGLGLATVYGIVQQHHGFIDVRSAPGEGATFVIHLPRAEAAPAPAPVPDDSLPAADGTGTILLVEDEPQVLRLTGMLLERFGYAVLAAGTPADAIHLAATHPGEIQLLMTDVIMPDMNGRQLADAIRARRPGIRVLYMSGYTANLVADRGVADGGEPLLQKPFTGAELAARVRAALDGPP